MFKIEVDIHTLVNGLKEVKRALGSKITLPATAGVKMVANEDGVFLTMVNPNVEMMIQSKLVAKTEESVLKVHESGAILIDAKRFIEYISKARTTLIKIEEVDEYEVVVRAGRGKMIFHKMMVERFPNIEIENNVNTFAVNSNSLLKGLQSTILFAKGDVSRPILDGVLFKIREGAITMQSTDSFRASEDKVDILTKVNEELDIVVPAMCLQKTFTLFTRGETVMITTDSHWIRFEVGEEVVAMRLLDGKYPENLDAILKSLSGGMTKLKFLRDELMQLTDRALLFKSDNNTSYMLMKWEEGATTVTFETKSDIGGVVEEIEIQNITNSSLSILFSAEFLKDALRSFPKSAEELEIDIYGDLRPFSIKEIGNDKSVRIIVPSRQVA